MSDRSLHRCRTIDLYGPFGNHWSTRLTHLSRSPAWPDGYGLRGRPHTGVCPPEFLAACEASDQSRVTVGPISSA